MAIAKRSRYREVETYTAPSAPMVLETVEDWLEARPPATSQVGEWWATIITPTRHMARAWLFVTYTWVRFLVALCLVTGAVVFIWTRLGG